MTLVRDQALVRPRLSAKLVALALMLVTILLPKSSRSQDATILSTSLLTLALCYGVFSLSNLFWHFHLSYPFFASSSK